jgi:hypothetical protein
LTFSKFIWIACLFTFWIVKCIGTTWSAAYPYTQHIVGQNVVVKAISYEPYSSSPMIGITRVYFDNKLLYSIDKYYRETIFTSNDGQYLVVVHSLNSTGVTSYTTFGNEQINFNQPAIEIFKAGKPFKTFELKDVVDTNKLMNDGHFFDWAYYVDFEAFDNAICNCNYWQKELTKSEKKDCSDGDATSYCIEWISGCDSAKIFEQEKTIYDNSIYVQDNSLFVLTNQHVVVKLDFSNLSLQKIPFEQIVPDKKIFNPPKVNRKYKKVNMPDKFDEPNLKDGQSFEKAVAQLFGLSVSANNEKKSYCVFIDNLVIDRNGKCIDCYGTVNDESISEFFLTESENKVMTEKLNQWAKAQTFQTKLIPEGFEAYSFLCIVYLN